MELKELPDFQELARVVAREAARLIQAAVEERGRAGLALSGGRSPRLFLEELARQGLPWERIWITLVDDRWVPPHHPDSNQGLIQRHLLERGAGAARFVGLWNDAPTPAEGLAPCHRALAGFPMPLDLAVLGMGVDGHTASFFPGAAGLKEALRPGDGEPCAAVVPPEAPHPRITLTLPVLVASRALFLLIQGREKREVLERALEEGPADAMPIRHILRSAGDRLTIFWAP